MKKDTRLKKVKLYAEAFCPKAVTDEDYDLTFICHRGGEHFAKPVLNELSTHISIQYLYVDSFWEFNPIDIKGKVVWVEWHQDRLIGY